MVFRNANDPNEVLVLLEWDGLERAQQFMNNDALRKIMERAGVVDQPSVYFLDTADRPAV